MAKWIQKANLQKTCLVCGSEFTTFIAWLRNGKAGKFCSRICQQKGRFRKKRTMISCVCRKCGNSFEIRKGSGSHGKYCSRACSIKDQGSYILTGSQHHRWKGGISNRVSRERKPIKEAIRKKGACERCGSKENLQGHHILPRREFPLFQCSESNIEVLCGSCHSKEHPEFSGMLDRPHIRKGNWNLCDVCESLFYRPPNVKKPRFCSRRCQLLYLNILRHQMKSIPSHG
jgi:hypothetical protein